MPDQLRSEGVATLRFTARPDGDFDFTAVGLDDVGGKAPGLWIRATLGIRLGSSDRAARVYLEAQLTTGSWVGIFIGPVLGLGFALLQDPSTNRLIVVLCGLAFGGITLMRGLRLMKRGWPGLLAEARRVATGSLYVPAA